METICVQDLKLACYEYIRTLFVFLGRNNQTNDAIDARGG